MAIIVIKPIPSPVQNNPSDQEPPGAAAPPASPAPGSGAHLQHRHHHHHIHLFCHLWKIKIVIVFIRQRGGHCPDIDDDGGPEVVQAQEITLMIILMVHDHDLEIVEAGQVVQEQEMIREHLPEKN